jgi:hypothetical protein
MTKTTQMLYKVFVRSYFRAHASQLLIFFTIFGIYFFFTPALKDSLLSFQERIYHNLLLAISIVSEPLFAILFAVLYLGYMISVYRHNKELLLQPQNTFLYYSINSLIKYRQLASWALANALVSFPFLVFICFSFVVGAVKGYFLIPLLLFLFVLVCICVYSLLLVRLLNAPINADAPAIITIRIKRKPLPVMFLLHVLQKKPQVILFSKMLSLFLTFLLFYFLREDVAQFQLSSLLGLIIALSNAYLLYEENKFNVSYLSFYRNLPVSRFTVFRKITFSWLLILIPEIVFCIITSTWWAIPSAVILLLFFRGVLVSFTQDFKRYFYIILCLFLILFLSILFNIFFVVLIPCFAIAYVLFHRFYYNPK